MRKWMLAMLLCLAALTVSVQAEGLPEDFLGELPDTLQETAQRGGGWEEGLAALWEDAGQSLGQWVRQGFAGVAGLLAVLVLCGVGESLLETAQGKKGLPYLTMAGGAAIVSLTAGELDQLIGLGTETITELDQFSKALLPTLATATASAGLVGTAAAKQVATVFFCDILITIIQRLLLPFLYLYIGAAAAGAMLGDGRLEAIAKAIKTGVSWSLKGLLTLFTLYLSVAGVISGAADAAAVKVTKAALSSAVPVAGSVLAGAAETLLAGAGAVKNTIGIFGVLAILAICLPPFLHLAVQYLLYKLAAFAASTAASPALVKLIDSLGSAFGLVLGMAGSCGLLLAFSVLSSILAVSV